MIYHLRGVTNTYTNALIKLTWYISSWKEKKAEWDDISLLAGAEHCQAQVVVMTEARHTMRWSHMTLWCINVGGKRCGGQRCGSHRELVSTLATTREGIHSKTSTVFIRICFPLWLPKPEAWGLRCMVGKNDMIYHLRGAEHRNSLMWWMMVRPGALKMNVHLILCQT